MKCSRYSHFNSGAPAARSPSLTLGINVMVKCQNRVFADQYHVIISRLELFKVQQYTEILILCLS